MPNLLKTMQSLLAPQRYQGQDILANQPLQPYLRAILEKEHPLLLAQYDQAVLPSIERTIAEQEKLLEIQAAAQPYIQEYIAEEARLQAQLQNYDLEPPAVQLPKALRSAKPKVVHEVSLKENQRVTWMVNIGLSSMLALAIAHYLGIRITRLRSAQELLLLILAILMAIGITLASKQAITTWVIRTRSSETERSFPRQIAFWERFQRGDSLSYVSIGLPVMEMFFAGPGLMELLPQSLADNFFYQASAFVVAGLTAVINVFLAWGQAWEKIEQRQQHQAHVDQYQAQNAEYNQAKRDRAADPQYQQICQRLQELGALLAQLQEEIAVQARIAQVQFDRTLAEGNYWWRGLERWQESNPRLLESV
jgi:uncharacterized membrane protein YphA (DoxX/SURF4 family)